MHTAFVLLVIVALASGSVLPEAREPQRIVGGSATSISTFPFSAALLFSSNLVTYWQNCGGAILNTRSVLSAAHCFYGMSAMQWRIRVGSSWANSGGSIYTTSQITVHPSYNNVNLDNDIAILQSYTIFNYISGSVMPGSIAGANYNVADNQVVRAIGWGANYYGGSTLEQLQQVQMWTINQYTCAYRYAEIGYTITDNMLCAGYLDFGGRGQCQGDDGSPLIHNNLIVGVYSFSYQCALGRYPAVNTRVSQYTSWILANA